MNWKEMAHLFCNGKFYVNLNTSGRIADKNPHPLQKIGIDRIYIWSTATCDWVGYPFNYCTLLARSIDDMSDDEMDEYRSKMHYDYFDSNDMSPKSFSSPESFMYLLSIGVLPPNFDTTDVIFIDKDS